MAFDPELGRKIHDFLKARNQETPFADYESSAGGSALRPDTVNAIAHMHHDTMALLGLNLDDPSLKDTPKRVAKMYVEELFKGLSYDNFPNCTTFPSNGNDALVAVKNIEVKSFCEHHFIPFFGTAFIGYIPNERLLGFSKFNRVVDFFSRRPQVQERLTEQVSSALQYILCTDDVAVVMECTHLCTKMRGIQDATSSTVTSRLKGKFFNNPQLRAEFMALANKHA